MAWSSRQTRQQHKAVGSCCLGYVLSASPFINGAAQPAHTDARNCLPVYSASRSPSALSKSRIVPSMQAASTQLWSWLTATAAAAVGRDRSMHPQTRSHTGGNVASSECIQVGRQTRAGLLHAPLTQVMGWCSSSVKRRPMRTSNRRRLPSTLPARISALRSSRK